AHEVGVVAAALRVGELAPGVYPGRYVERGVEGGLRVDAFGDRLVVTERVYVHVHAEAARGIEPVADAHGAVVFEEAHAEIERAEELAEHRGDEKAFLGVLVFDHDYRRATVRGRGSGGAQRAAARVGADADEVVARGVRRDLHAEEALRALVHRNFP